MPASLDLLLPVGAHPFAPAESTLVRGAVEESLTDGLWVRDLPCVPTGDPDVGQGGDPFADLAHLCGLGWTAGSARSARPRSSSACATRSWSPAPSSACWPGRAAGSSSASAPAASPP